MSRMLREETADEPVVRFGAQTLYIDGETYDNTAAKFWSGLIDEVLQDYPGCDTITLAATGSVPLSVDLLFPVNELVREIESGEAVGLEEAIRLAEQEIAMFGPPRPVSLGLFSGLVTMKEMQLPRECVDDQVFSYLLAWLLRWCAIPEAGWNAEHLSGRIGASDLHRKLAYGLSIAFHNRHLSEGLFGRTVTVLFQRKRQE